MGVEKFENIRNSIFIRIQQDIFSVFHLSKKMRIGGLEGGEGGAEKRARVETNRLLAHDLSDKSNRIKTG